MADRFDLHGPRDDAFVQSLALALGLRGVGVRRIIAPKSRLFINEIEVSGGVGACLERLETHFPKQSFQPSGQRRLHEERRMMALAERALQELALLIGAAAPQDLDLAIHRLRGKLAELQSGLPALAQDGQGVSTLDCLLLPMLWRIKLLDQAFGSYIALGFERLSAHGDRLLDDAEIARLFSDRAAGRFLMGLRAGDRAIAQTAPDWTRALGPMADIGLGNAGSGRMIFSKTGQIRKIHPLAALPPSASDFA